MFLKHTHRKSNYCRGYKKYQSEILFLIRGNLIRTTTHLFLLLQRVRFMKEIFLHFV